MARAPKSSTATTAKEEPLEKQLWRAADKLRKNIDAAEYKHVVLGLIFLKYISDSFEELHARLTAEKTDGADPEDVDEYKAERVFFVPPAARWSHLLKSAKLPAIGKIVDDAMDAIERDNPQLKGVLPKVFARQNLDSASLGGLIDLIGNMGFRPSPQPSPSGRGCREATGEGDIGTGLGGGDVLGRVFEYFLGEFALAEGKQGGQFYTPRSIVELLVAMLEPYKGRVFDPCCGSGGMFVQSERFVKEHQGRVEDISIYGQESNQTTWRLAKMNLAIRSIDSTQVKWNNEGSFLNDAHKDLRVEFILANPPFNDSDWSGELLQGDARWRHGKPPAGNANFAWLQHFIAHLAPAGKAGIVLAKGALTSKTSGEGDIRKAMITDGNLIDCIVNLPAKLFLNTQIPAALWLLRRGRGAPDSLPSPQPSPSGRGGLVFSGLVETARELRKKATPAEEIFWELVRDRRFLDLKFRRQHQIGHYIVDFYCHEKNLIIELDGAVHDTEERQKKDKKRDAYLQSLGNKVIRISNEKIISDPESVLIEISGFASPSPRPAGHPSPNCLRQSLTPASGHPSPTGRGVGGEGEVPEKQTAEQQPLNRSNEILFIDARNLGHLINRRTRELSHEDIQKIVSTYHAWRGSAELPLRSEEAGRKPRAPRYEDIKGFCASVPLSRVAELDYVLTPGRYVGLPDEEDDFNFAERFAALKVELAAQIQEEEKLNKAIQQNLARVKL